MGDVAATWLGHAAFRFDSPGGTRIYLDPWLGNPTCPEAEREPERVDVIALTHGHDDHVGETVELAKRFSPTIVSMVELRAFLGRQGIAADSRTTFNKGGTVEAGGVAFTMTDAKHSSSCPDGQYGGEAAGFVMAFEDGTKIYAAGDTCVFGDMELIGRLYSPDVAILPIGGHYTMDPEQAALALELLGVTRCVPCHYGTFPLLAGTPEELRAAAPGVEVIAPEPGETVTL
jgi:L-ascorbate metabolism protein UlaG (beta-lactamase superfamily)